jgi:hypothetical protein
MQYQDLNGQVATAEPWSPGPMFGCIWALRPDGSPVVIHATKKLEIAPEMYQQPARPKTDVNPQLLAVAKDIMRRRRLAGAAKSKDWYQQKYIVSPGDALIENPTDDQVAVARTLIAQDNHNERAHKVFREAHYASNPIAAKRLFDLWLEEGFHSDSQTD